jgi:hypothetical protein
MKNMPAQTIYNKIKTIRITVGPPSRGFVALRINSKNTAANTGRV